jgi:hypothetical protein
MSAPPPTTAVVSPSAPSKFRLNVSFHSSASDALHTGRELHAELQRRPLRPHPRLVPLAKHRRGERLTENLERRRRLPCAAVAVAADMQDRLVVDDVAPGPLPTGSTHVSLDGHDVLARALADDLVGVQRVPVDDAARDRVDVLPDVRVVPPRERLADGLPEREPRLVVVRGAAKSCACQTLSRRPVGSGRPTSSADADTRAPLRASVPPGRAPGSPSRLFSLTDGVAPRRPS